MKIISWNVNGIRSIFSKNFISSMNMLAPDIICLQEIKAVKDQFPEELVDFTGYKLFVNSADKKGYSGVAIYTKVAPVSVSDKLGHTRFDSEGRFLRLDFDDFSLINVYIPNGSRDKSNFEYKFEIYDLLIEYLKKNSDINFVIVGDFNVAHEEIDLASPKENVNNTMFTPAERDKLQMVYDLGYIDTFRLLNKEGDNYSWWAYFRQLRERNIGWRIDYAFVSPGLKDKVGGAFIEKEVLGSDHCPVGIEIAL